MTRRAFDDLLVAMVDTGRDASGSRLDALAVASATTVESLHVAIQLRTDGYPTSGMGTSSTDARDGLELQLALGEGPAVDARGLGLATAAADLATESRWPLARPALMELGFAAVSAYPLQIGASRLGSFSDYRRECSVTVADDLRWGIAVADALTQVLLASGTSDDADGLAITELGWLASPAGDSPAVVHQATGMIAVQVDCELEEALVRLRARAFAESTSLTDLAHQVVGRTLRFDR